MLVTISDRKIAVDDGTYTFGSNPGPQGQPDVPFVVKTNNTPDGVMDYYTADVVTAGDYYPFGMVMPGRKFSAGNGKYRYGFNGKENDNDVKGVEGGQQDYGMRIYDPRLGRFLSVDPIADDFPWWTPYQFAGNTPVNAIDLDGLEVPPGKNKNKTENALNKAFNILGGVDFSTAKLPRREYVSKNSFGALSFFANAETFGNNVSVSVWNNIIGTAESSINSLTPGGNLKLMYEDILPTAKFIFIDWGTFTPEQQLNYLKAVLTDPETYENLVATLLMAVVTERFLPKIKIQYPKELRPVVDYMKRALNEDVPLCFAAGTKIWVKGSLKNIEDIIIGDSVWAYNETTGLLALKKVYRVLVKEAWQIVRIYAAKELISTTLDHPFWVRNTWTEARNLQIGDSLTLFEGSKCKVDSIAIYDTVAKVYNFAVEDFHTYYVSPIGVLVHNSDPCIAQGKKWTNHANKHVPPVRVSWEDIVLSTKNGAAKYKPGVDIQSLETKVLNQGIQVKSKNWKVMKHDGVIGAKYGKETQYSRVEITSDGTYHGHPITEIEYKKLIKQ